MFPPGGSNRLGVIHRTRPPAAGQAHNELHFKTGQDAGEEYIDEFKQVREVHIALS